MAGYSGTPLGRKLGLKPDMKAFLYEMPTAVRRELKKDLAAVDVVPAAAADMDFIHGFVHSRAELKKNFPKWKRQLAKTGALWVSWPKKASTVKTDLDGDFVREFGLETGLVDIKVCAVDETWSGLKFVWRKADR